MKFLTVWYRFFFQQYLKDLKLGSLFETQSGIRGVLIDNDISSKVIVTDVKCAEEDRDYYIRRLGKQAATEIMAYGRMGTGNTSSILLMNKEDQQSAMQGALTLQKGIDKNMAVIDRKIDAAMPLSSDGGYDPLASIQNENNVHVLEQSKRNK